MINKIKTSVLEKFKDDERRLEHILGVVSLSLDLAKLNKVEKKKMEIAAYFHDYSKGENLESLEKLISPYLVKRYKDVPE